MKTKKMFDYDEINNDMDKALMQLKEQGYKIREVQAWKGDDEKTHIVCEVSHREKIAGSRKTVMLPIVVDATRQEQLAYEPSWDAAKAKLVQHAEHTLANWNKNNKNKLPNERN